MIFRANNLGLNSYNSDLPASDLPPDGISFAKNCITRDNKIYAFNGRAPVLTAPPSNFSAGYIDFLRGSTNFFLVAGRSAVYVTDGSLWYNISNSAGYTGLSSNDELLWTGCKLNRIPVIANIQSFPEYWNPQTIGTLMQDLPFDASSTWRTKNYRCRVIRSHAGFLFALNLSEGGIDKPLAYRWSHPADINGLPFTWDEADLSGLAGNEQLGSSSEKIVDGLSLRDSFAIYATKGVHILERTGDEFVWARRPLSETYGLLTANAVVEAAGSHFLLSDGDIVRNDGNQLVSVLSKKVKRNLETRLSGLNYNNCFATLQPITKEIWFFIVEEGSIFPNIAYIVNYEYGTVNVRDIQGSTAFAVSGLTAIAGAADSWEADTIIWDGLSDTWEGIGASPFSESLVGVDNSNSRIYSLELNDLTTFYSTLVERLDFTFPDVGDDEVTTILHVIPHIKSSGPVKIELGSKTHIEAPIRWKTSATFNPTSQRKIDIRTSGTLHCWRISSIGTNSFQLTGLSFEYVIDGKRY